MGEIFDKVLLLLTLAAALYGGLVCVCQGLARQDKEIGKEDHVMTYKGFEIREIETRTGFGAVIRRFGIFSGEKMLAPVESVPLAKRVIDERIRTGRWKEGAVNE